MATQEIPNFVEEVMEAPPTHINLDIPSESKMPRRRILHRVPPQVRENKKHIYDPVIVSLGPYHHGHPQFARGETFKHEVFSIMLECAVDVGFLFRSTILEQINEIRSFYGGLSEDEYDDVSLAEMMLRDACLVLYIMESQTEHGHEKCVHIVRRLGMSTVGFMIIDLFILENQMPMWVINLLISLTSYDDVEDVPLLYKFMSYMVSGDHRLARLLHEDGEKEPLHILNAFRASMFKKCSTRNPMKMKWHYPILDLRRCKTSSYFEQIDSSFGSASQLKAKGIHSSLCSDSFKNIRFNSYLFYGKLQLPLCIVTDCTKVVLSNMIALEMSPDSDTNFAVTSHVSFFKLLIQNSEDVKELRDKGIIISTLGNDEEVAKIFSEMDGYDFYNIFHEVKMKVNQHCNNKVKIWIAQLIHTYFRSPWNVVAIVAATFVLCLSFLQTYYTMSPTICRNN